MMGRCVDILSLCAFTHCPSNLLRHIPHQLRQITHLSASISLCLLCPTPRQITETGERMHLHPSSIPSTPDDHVSPYTLLILYLYRLRQAQYGSIPPYTTLCPNNFALGCPRTHRYPAGNTILCPDYVRYA